MEGEDIPAKSSITLEELNQAMEKDLISQFYEEEFHLNHNVFEHILSPNFENRVRHMQH